MRDNDTKKVKLKVKGKMRNGIHKYFAHRKARKHGLIVHDMNYSGNEHIDIFMEGSRSDVWAMVNWHKRGPILCSVTEVDVEFID